MNVDGESPDFSSLDSEEEKAGLVDEVGPVTAGEEVLEGVEEMRELPEEVAVAEGDIADVVVDGTNVVVVRF